jgi:hypothetical protein
MVEMMGNVEPAAYWVRARLEEEGTLRLRYPIKDRRGSRLQTRPVITIHQPIADAGSVIRQRPAGIDSSLFRSCHVDADVVRLLQERRPQTSCRIRGDDLAGVSDQHPQKLVLDRGQADFLVL